MKKLSLLTLIIGLSLVSGNLLAEANQRDASGAASAKAQMMLRQIAADRDTLKVENTSLQQEIDKLKKQVDSLKSEKAKLSGKINNADQTIGKYNEANEKLRERINKDRERTGELIAKFKETVITLKRIETQRSELDGNLKVANQQLSECANNNVELYKTNLELVELYKDKSMWDAFLQKEPATQIGRVTIENIGQQYVNKVQDLQFVDNTTE